MGAFKSMCPISNYGGGAYSLPRSMQPRTLVALALVGFGLKYTTSIVVAGALGVEHYDEYAVPVASIVLLSTLAELGMGKNGLKRVPQYLAQGREALASGYIRFTLAVVLLCSGIVGGITAAIEFEVLEEGGLPTPVLAAFFLPALALVGALAELVTARGGAVAAAIVTRVLVPLLPLSLVFLLTHEGGRSLSPLSAVGAYGSGWMVGGFVLSVVLFRSLRFFNVSASMAYRPLPWLKEGIGMLGVALCTTFLLEGSLIIAELAAVPESDVSILAVCLETGAFVYLLSKSLDKAYLPRMTANLERGDIEAIDEDRRVRARLVAMVCGVFSAFILLFGRETLGLFGPGFERGYVALCLVTVGACAMTFSSISQWGLAFLEGPRQVLLVLGIAVLSLTLGSAFLGPLFGLEGVAVTYAVVLVAASVFLRQRAMRLLARLRDARE